MGQKARGKGSDRAAKAKRAQKKAPQAALTEAQIRALPKPRSNYEELVDKAVAAWTRRRDKVRPPDLTPAKLASRVQAARRAQAAERKIRAAFEQRLRSASDRRLVADAEAWKSLLYLWSTIKPIAERYPEVREDFRFLEEALSPRRASAPVETPASQPPAATPAAAPPSP